MSFFRLFLVVAALSVLTAAHVCADEATTTTSPSAAEVPPAGEGPTQQETVVNGTPPRLLGKWLAVTWIETGNGGRFTTMPALWQIAQQDGKLVMTTVLASLPEPLKSDVSKATNENTHWAPTPENLAFRRIEAIGDSIEQCVTMLKSRGLDPKKFEFTRLPRPF